MSTPQNTTAWRNRQVAYANASAKQRDTYQKLRDLLVKTLNEIAMSDDALIRETIILEINRYDQLIKEMDEDFHYLMELSVS